MNSNQEESADPWKRRSRIELIACTDVIIAILGIVYSSYRMFTFYWNLENENVSKFIKDPDHFPFYVFIWVIVLILYAFQMGTSFVLFSAINREATETDPYISIQKCNCWLRCSRLVLGVVVIKLCLFPIIIVVGNYFNVYNFAFGFAELIFRTAAIFSVKGFMEDLQQ